MHLWGWLVVSMVLAGRSPWIAPADPDARTVAANQALINAPAVTVEVIRVNGAAAPDRALNEALRLFARYVTAPPQVIRNVEIHRAGAETRDIGRADIIGLLNAAPDGPLAAVTLIVWPGKSLVDFSAFYQMVQHRGRRRSIVVMHQPVDLLPALLRNMLWTHVLLHELCHALHVPADRSHVWSGRHCTHPDCILYPRLDRRSFLATVLNLGPSWRLCEACRAEAQAARR